MSELTLNTLFEAIKGDVEFLTKLIDMYREGKDVVTILYQIHTHHPIDSYEKFKDAVMES
jgi:hypothetical protein